jgi:hypothetical protein
VTPLPGESDCTCSFARFEDDPCPEHGPRPGRPRAPGLSAYMPTTYRACVITNSVRTRDMIPPSIHREFARDSKAALADTRAAFLKMLADHIPSDGARAWFERSDRHGAVTLARYLGIPTERDATTGRETAGTWVYEHGCPGTLDTLPNIVHAGLARKGAP